MCRIYGQGLLLNYRKRSDCLEFIDHQTQTWGAQFAQRLSRSSRIIVRGPALAGMRGDQQSMARARKLRGNAQTKNKFIRAFAGWNFWRRWVVL